MRVSIIGTAGRSSTEPLSLDLYLKAVEHVRQLVVQWTDPKTTTLVSGGAAWMDHIAVGLYQQGFAPGLELHFPAPWRPGELQFDPTHFSGKTANYYHRRFSARLGADPAASLRGLQEALNRGAQHSVHVGFKARNVPVSQADLLIALTWGTTAPSSTGTLHTWNLAQKSTRIHVCLSSFQDHVVQRAGNR